MKEKRIITIIFMCLLPSLISCDETMKFSSTNGLKMQDLDLESINQL